MVEKGTDFSPAGKVLPRLQPDPQDTHRFLSGHHPVSRLCWGACSDPHQPTLLERRSLSWMWTDLEPSRVFSRRRGNVSPFTPPPLGKRGCPDGSDGEESTCNAGDLGSTPGSGRFPGGGHSNPLQYSCLENSTDREAWWATVYWVANNQTRLNN